MTILLIENQPEQGECFEGNRPLITHNRKRNAIPAEISETTHRSPKQEKKKNPDIPAASCGPTHHLPPPTRKRVLVRRDKAAMFKAKVKALIECYKPVEPGPRNEIRNRPQRPPRKAVRFE